ncbi:MULTISPECIES: MbtH family protein [Streptomycetaceae]|uniref:MbtH family protein n=1 Tax=Streptomycetaceae TaxID=2062 RepID=UPI00093A285B|nr:MbtH family protein [Streptomyces sp. CB02056]OKI03026.1 protein mbtH [Streptomyces sp. CB02056]
MTNPFEDPDAGYLVLVNDEGQHSLWPASLAVPGGWAVAHAEDTRDTCLEYIDRQWTDMRPRGLAGSMQS